MTKRHISKELEEQLKKLSQRADRIRKEREKRQQPKEEKTLEKIVA